MSTMLTPEHVLEGPGLASSFGYDVAVVDLNGDGQATQDLLKNKGPTENEWTAELC